MKLFNLLLILSSLFIIGCGEKKETVAELEETVAELEETIAELEETIAELKKTLPEKIEGKWIASGESILQEEDVEEFMIVEAILEVKDTGYCRLHMKMSGWGDWTESGQIVDNIITVGDEVGVIVLLEGDNLELSFPNSSIEFSFKRIK